MRKGTETTNNEYFVIVADLSQRTEEINQNIKDIKLNIEPYDEKKLYEINDSNEGPPYLVYKLSLSEYEKHQKDELNKGSLITSEKIGNIGPVSGFEWEDDHGIYDHRASPIIFPNSFIVRNCYILNQTNSKTLQHEMALTTKKLHDSTLIPIEEKRRIGEYLNSREADSVWRSQALTPDCRIAAAAVLARTDHAIEMVRELPKIHQDIITTIKRVQMRGSQCGIDACDCI